MLLTIKNKILKSKELTIPFYISTNFGMALASALFPKAISSSARTTSALNVEEELSKFETEFSMYMDYLKPEEIPGKTILEIGTGANFLVALKLVAMGAEKVVCLDKYACLRSPKDQHRIYSSFLERLSDKEKKRLVGVLDIDSESFMINPDRIIHIQKNAIDFKAKKKFDIVISYAVFEHIPDLRRLFGAIQFNMATNSKFVSLVGNNDHGIFSLYHGELYYYRIPEPIWSLMTANSGRPNRKTPSYYSKLLDENGFSHRIYVRSLKKHPGFIQPPVPIENVRDFCKQEVLDEVSANKQKFSKEFRHLPEEDLLVSHFILVAEKTSNPQ